MSRSLLFALGLLALGHPAVAGTKDCIKSAEIQFSSTSNGSVDNTFSCHQAQALTAAVDYCNYIATKSYFDGPVLGFQEFLERPLKPSTSTDRARILLKAQWKAIPEDQIDARRKLGDRIIGLRNCDAGAAESGSVKGDPAVAK